MKPHIGGIAPFFIVQNVPAALHEFVVHTRLAGHGPTLFAGLSKHVDLKPVSRLEFGSGWGCGMGGKVAIGLDRGATMRRRLTPISPPVVKGTDLFRPAVESRRRVTVSNKRRITVVPFSAVFVSSAGSHPHVGMDPNTY